ncbi:MAG TPA: CHAD domain-containing protein [Gemmatimonadales bacterium]|jgi:CHAD domain-containing protein/CYTH domain-containing protein|nr:CHAD domain-containing protein [Gemmatimonadales bacterium]
MNLPASALQHPASEVARQLALGLLAEAGQARDRLNQPGDTEALHDFRVGLRRVRSVLRAYRPCVEDSVGRKLRRRLKRLAQASGASRDLQVHLAWLAQQKPTLRYMQRVGLAWLMRRLRTAKRAADAGLSDQVARRFPAIRQRLEQRLTKYTVTVGIGGLDREPTYAAVTTGLLLEHAEEVKRRLGQVKSLADQTEAHQARIQAKRLRYLLEPVVGLFADGEELLARLKALQDTLGELHDAHVFSQEIGSAIGDAAAEDARRLSEAVLAGASTPQALRRLRRRDPRSGMLEITTRLRDRSDQAFARLQESGWLADGADGFFERLTAFAHRLASTGDEHTEIERKYLLSGLPATALDLPSDEMAQGYLPGDRLTERLRHVTSADGERWYRTVKAGTGVRRIEIEEETSRELFDGLWPFTVGHRLMKKRRRVEQGGVAWEIDEFCDRDLVLAEIELPSESTVVTPPDWLKPYLVREVTGEPEYQNYTLAR